MFKTAFPRQEQAKHKATDFCLRRTIMAENNRICRLCNKPFHAPPSWIKKGDGIYCSRDCARKAQIKVHRAIEYKGMLYRTNTYGYYVSCEKRPNILHRVIWEEYHGKIPAGYIVHHKDGNKTNNSIENLELMERGKHTSIHNSTGKKLCLIDNCKNLANAKGLCPKHYARARAEQLGHW